jgi:hypothetical protein
MFLVQATVIPNLYLEQMEYFRNKVSSFLRKFTAKNQLMRLSSPRRGKYPGYLVSEERRFQNVY